MSKKILYGILLFLAMTIFSVTYCFANDFSRDMEDAANGVRDVVGGAENTVEDAAAGVVDGSKDITRGIENAGKNMKNNMQDNMQNTTNYSTTRTSTTATTNNNATFLGMNSTTWIWLILALAAIGIIAIVYNFSKQNNDDYDQIIND